MTEWKDLEELVTDLMIRAPSNDLPAIRRELRARLKQLYGISEDSADGAPDDEALLQISSAMQFLKETERAELVPLRARRSLQAAQDVPSELAIWKSQAALEASAARSRVTLTSRLKKTGRLPTIYLATMSSVLAFLFAFPEQVKNHPVSERLSEWYLAGCCKSAVRH